MECMKCGESIRCSADKELQLCGKCLNVARRFLGKEAVLLIDNLEMLRGRVVSREESMEGTLVTFRVRPDEEVE